MNSQPFFRYILVGCCLGFFAWIINEHIPFAGEKHLTYTFGEVDGTITHPRPLARLQDILKPEMKERMVEDPVYFDIRTRVSYESLHLSIQYAKHTSRPLSLGVRVGAKDAWSYRLLPLIPEKSNGSWMYSEIDIPLESSPRIDNKYTFLFSVPGLRIDTSGTEYVDFKSMHLTLKRRPCTLTDIRSLIRDAFGV